jgi:hypothetical protein
MACAHFMFSARPRGVPRGHAALQGHIAGDEVRKRAGNAALCGEGTIHIMFEPFHPKGYRKQNRCQPRARGS